MPRRLRAVSCSPAARRPCSSAGGPRRIDVDIKLLPDQDALLRAIPELKESLRLNVELASPDDFIPVREGWADRSPFIVQEGKLTFHHFDLEAQALSKIERGHTQDRADVRAMLDLGLVSKDGLRAAFTAIEPLLYKSRDQSVGIRIGGRRRHHGLI